MEWVEVNRIWID